MEQNKKEILKYIQNEKDISRYHISTLEKSNNLSSYKKRILSMEKEFVCLPLEVMPFEDVADVAAAISIYKTSRNLFYKTYNMAPPEHCDFNKSKYLTVLEEKLRFVQNTARAYMGVRVQELNLVQNSDFNYDLVKRQSLKNGTSIEIEKRQLDTLNLQMLLNIEPLTIAKKRARAQAAIFSIGKYLWESSKNISIEENLSLESLQEAEQRLDTIIKNLKYNVFRYYNDGLNVLPSQLQGTMGENLYLSKIHDLQNVLDFSVLKRFGVAPKPISNPEGFSSQKPVLGNIFFGSKKAISMSSTKDAERNVQNKVFGVLLPIPRKGNEKMSLLYKNIVFENKNISHLFSDGISNVKALRGTKEVYFKAILMEPLWKIISMAFTDTISREVLTKIIDLNQDNYEDVNFDNKTFINKINNKHLGFFPLSENSVVLTAKTRSEEEGLLEIFPIINSKISEINEDYFRLTYPTNEIFLD